MYWKEFHEDTIVYKKRAKELDKVKITCKCGHREVIPIWVDMQLCSWCGHYVYRNKNLEFKDKLKKEMEKKNGIFKSWLCNSTVRRI